MADKKQNLVQTSVRLHAEILEAIRLMSESSGVPQSEVIRAAITMYKLHTYLDEPLKLAVVDLSKGRPGGYYFVDKFVINESD